MSALAPPSPALPSDVARTVAAAPHRLLFLAGTLAVLLSMAWWALVLAARVGDFAPPQAAMPPGWVHAFAMQQQVLALFVFGFLLTVVPRWTGDQPIPPLHYVPVAGALFAGYLATLAGLSGAPRAFDLGLGLTALGWIAALLRLAPIVLRDAGRTAHAVSTWFALALGLLAVLGYAKFRVAGDAMSAFAAIKLGTFGFLLPMYFTVTHRMLPFFSQCVYADYRPWRPTGVLVAAWLMLLAHLALELMHAYTWSWPVDLALAALFATCAWRWHDRRVHAVGLLRVLHLAFAWLPLAFALYALQSAWFAWTGDFILGRAPLHALAIGYFGSMLVAMVTRVTAGHSGRPLAMSRVAWVAFVGVQLCAVLRIGAELAADPAVGYLASAVAWLAAFAPWVLRNAWIYVTPRADGREG